MLICLRIFSRWLISLDRNGKKQTGNSLLFSVLMIVFQTHSFIRDSFSLRHFVGDNIFLILSYIDSLPYKPMELITLETSE